MGRIAQLVIGPAGSGKSTYCFAMQNHMLSNSNRLQPKVINLDPGQERSEEAEAKFPFDLDVRDLISVADVMEELEFGPNGALVFCMEHLVENLQWLEEGLDEIGGSQDEYFIFDCPGQIELYTHIPVLATVLRRLQELNILVCVVHVIDALFIDDTSKFISGALLSLTSMMHLHAPSVNVITKCDIKRANRLGGRRRRPGDRAAPGADATAADAGTDAAVAPAPALAAAPAPAAAHTAAADPEAQRVQAALERLERLERDAGSGADSDEADDSVLAVNRRAQRRRRRQRRTDEEEDEQVDGDELNEHDLADSDGADDDVSMHRRSKAKPAVGGRSAVGAAAGVSSSGAPRARLPPGFNQDVARSISAKQLDEQEGEFLGVDDPEFFNPDGMYLRAAIREQSVSDKFKRLSESICTVLESYNLVSFLPLDISDDSSIEFITHQIDVATQYGEDLEPRDPGDVAEQDEEQADADDGDD